MVRSDHGFHACIMPRVHTRPMLNPSVLCVTGLVLLTAQAAWAQPVPTAAAPLAATVLAAPAARFDVFEYEVQGNSVLPALAVEAAVLPFMGAQRTLADVEAARGALEKACQNAGFLTVFVDLPEQRVADGLVRLNVTEGRIERLRVTGARHFSQGFIRETAAALQAGGLPNFNTLQAQLADLNRTPDRQVQPVLRPGREPGTVEVELKVKDRLPLSATLDLHNKHAANTTPTRLVGSLRYDNLLQRDQALALTLISAPEALQESQVLVANWTSPLADQASLVTSLVLSNSRVEPLGATVLGKGFTLGLRWALPLLAADSVHSVSLGFEYRDLKQRVANGGSEVSTPLRYLPLQASHTGQWRHEAGASTVLISSLALGLRGLLARSVPCPGTTLSGLQDQFACNRDGADGGFVTLRGDLRHGRAFAGGALALRGAWQLAMQPLVSGEQFALGGADTVRGYFESEASGDQVLAQRAALPATPARDAVPVPRDSKSGGWQLLGTSQGTAPPDPSANAKGGRDLVINQTSARAIYQWRSFNIGADSHVRFNMPDANSSALNRVDRGAAPSAIFGQLSSNGTVYLLNGNGILFGNSARVDVRSLIASTLNLGNDDYVSGLTNSLYASQASFVRDADGLGAPAVGSGFFIEVQAGAQITTPAGGRVFLFAED